MRISYCIFVGFCLELSLACISSPRRALVLKIPNKEEPKIVGSEMSVELKVLVPTPDFRTILKVGNTIVDESVFIGTATPTEKTLNVPLDEAGAPLPVTLEAVWLGRSLVIEEMIYVYRPIQQGNFELILEGLPLFPPGNVLVTLRVFDPVEVPNNIYGKVTWGDSSPPESLDLMSIAASGTSQNRLYSLKHKYQTIGEYTVEVQLYNNVSEAINVLNIRLIEGLEIRDIIISYENPDLEATRTSNSSFQSATSLRFSTIVKSGNVDVFYLTVGRRNMSSSTLPISYVVPWAGSYVVEMWVSGEAGLSNIINKTVTIQKGIRTEQLTLHIQDIIITPPGLTTLNITLEDEVEFPTDISGAITWDENFVQPIDWKNLTRPGQSGILDFLYSYSYVDNGNYSINIALSNLISQVSIYAYANVIHKLVIRNLSVSNSRKFDNEHDDVFQSTEKLYFRVGIVSGLPESFVLEVEGTQIMSSSQPMNLTMEKAGVYNFRMWVIGEAGYSNNAYETLSIQRAIEKSHLELGIQDIIVSPPGYASLNVSLGDQTELPTNISGSITWNDGSTEELDWVSNTNDGYKGTISQTFLHTYSMPKNYSINVMLSNLVSSITSSISAYVIPKLGVENVYVSVDPLFENGNADTFESMEELYFQTDIKSGDSNIFYLGVEGGVISSNFLPINYTFRWAGSYVIEMWVSGEAGLSNIVNKTVTIQKSIKTQQLTLQIQDIIVTPPGLTTLNITLEDEAELPTDISGAITWDENFVQPIDWKNLTRPGQSGILDFLYTHSYVESGNYSINIELPNLISQVSISVYANVIPELVIGNLSVSNSRTFDNEHDDVFQCTEELYFRVGIVSGLPESFILKVEGSKIMSASQPMNLTFEKAGVYNLRMWVIGEAGYSNIAYKTLSIQRALEISHLELGIQDIIVSPPGYASLNVSLSDQTELPTNISGSITWNDGSTEELDWISNTNAGYKGTISQTFLHTYSMPKNYSINVMLSNLVSSITSSISAYVIPKLGVENVYVSVDPLFENGNADTFESMEELYFQTEIKSGDSSIFYLGVEGGVISSNFLPINYTFRWAGSYVIEMWVSGEAGLSNIVNKTVTIQKGIKTQQLTLQIQDIIVTPPGLTTLNITLEDEAELPTDISGAITWNENFVQPIDWKNLTMPGQSGILDFLYTHSYVESGNYSINIELSNLISQVSISVYANVIPELVIGNLSVSNSRTFDNEHDDVFQSTEELYFRVGIVSGLPESFILKVEGSKIMSASQPMNLTFEKAGVYNLRMWVIGEAGYSNIAYKTLSIQRALEISHLELGIQDIIVSPPGYASLNVNLGDQTELPTNISGSITWNDGSTEELDWVSNTNAGYKGTISQTFLHTYSMPKNYSIKVMLSNLVSSITSAISAYVIPKLGVENVYVSVDPLFENGNADTFESMEELYFQTDIKSGDSSIFYLGVEGGVISSNFLPINYTFRWAGSYVIEMWVSGEAGLSNIVNKTVTIQKGIKTQQLTLQIHDIIVTPPGLTTLNITLEDEAELPTDISGAITWDENFVQPIDWKNLTRPGQSGILDFLYTHSYVESGNYSINIALSNLISQVSISVYANVIPELVIGNLSASNSRTFDNEQDDVFQSTEELYFRVGIVSGLPESFVLKVEESKIMSASQPMNLTFKKAGVYNLRMWVIGEAGYSNIAYKTLSIQRALEISHLELGIQDIIVSPPGYASLNVSLSDQTELPTNISGSITWNDGSTEELDWVGNTNAGYKGTLSQTFLHTYSMPKNYSIKVMLSNLVSSITSAISAYVIPKLGVENVYVSVDPLFENGNADTFESMEELYFQTDIKSGDSSIFYLGVEGGVISSNFLPINYTFRWAGSYVIEMWVSGEAGLSNIVNKTVTIQKGIKTQQLTLQIQDIIVTPPGLTTLNITLEDEAELPTDISGAITWDENFVQPIDWKNLTRPGQSGILDFLYTHSYVESGNYSINIALSNLISQVSISVYANVIPELVIGNLSASNSRTFDNEHDDVFQSTEELYFRVGIVSGLPESFVLKVEESKIMSASQPMNLTFEKAGVYNLRMWVIGEAGYSNIAYKTLSIQRALEISHLELGIQDIIVSPPGYASLNVSLSDQTELPTNISGSITWNDGSTEELDWVSNTNAGYKGTISQTFLHTYSMPKNYSINVMLSNLVSSITSSISAYVIPKLGVENVYVSEDPLFENGNADTFESMEELYFQTDIKSGDSSIFYLGVEGGVISSNSLPINYTFRWAGSYEIQMWVSGEAGLSNVVNKTITIQKGLRIEQLTIEIQDIIVTPPGLATLNVTLEDEMELPTDISGAITWDENFIQPIDWKNLTRPGQSGILDFLYSHTYVDSGNYSINIELTNLVTDLSTSILAHVIPELVIRNLKVSSSLQFDEISNASIFASFKELYFQVDVISGSPAEFFIEVNGTDNSSTFLPMKYSFDEAGVYDVRMWCTGLSGISNILKGKVTIQREVTFDNSFVDTPDLVITPPGLTGLNVTIKDDVELPTEVKGLIIWEDDVSTPFDWRLFTPAGKKGTISLTFYHNYAYPGNYSIVTRISNLVSNAYINKTVFVISEVVIQGLFVQSSEKEGNNTRVFPKHKTLNISTLVLKGMPETFYLDTGGNLTTSDQLPIKYIFNQNGIYKLSLWVTGLGSTSNIVSREITIQDDIQSEDIQIIGLGSRPVGYLGQANFSVYLKDQFMHETLITIQIDWGDSASETFVLNKASNAINESIVIKNFGHVYQTHGNYSVEVKIENDVSTYTEIFMVFVAQKISLEGIRVEYEDPDNAPESVLCAEAFALLSDNRIVFAPQTLVGNAISWTLNIGNESTLESSEGSFTYNFSKPGWYVIRLTAFGLDEDMETTHRSIFMGEEVKSVLGNVYPNVTKLNLPTLIAVRASWVMGSCLTVFFGDGDNYEKYCDPTECSNQRDDLPAERRPSSPDVFARHVYQSPGTFRVDIILTGPINEIKKNLTVEITEEVLCDLLDVNIRNRATRDNPTKVRRQDMVRLESSNVNVGCRGEVAYKIEWTVHEIDDSLDSFSPAKFLAQNKTSEDQVFNFRRSSEMKIGSKITSNSSVLIIPKNTLSYGSYYASVSYNFSIANKNITREAKLVDITVVEIVKSQLISKMIGSSATSIVRGDMQILRLCASCYSQDPDEVSKFIGFTWWCKRKGEEWDSRILNLPSSPPDLNGQEDLGGCFGTGPGKINVTEGSLRFNSSLFYKVPEDYVMKVEVVSDDGRRSTNELQLEIVPGNPPILISSCSPITSCSFFDGVVSVNPIKLVLASSCVQEETQSLATSLDLGDDGCGSPPVEYEWIIYGVNLASDPIQLNISKYSAGMNRANFALLDTFWSSPLNIYAKYEVVVSGRREGEESFGKTKLIMQLNYAPDSGACQILRDDTQNIVALVETVHVNCTGWKDPENRGIGRYKFSVVYKSGTKNPLWAGQELPASLILPYANFTLEAEIFDVQEAVTVYNIAQLSTVPPSSEAYDAYLDSGKLDKALDQKELSLVNMLLQAENSVRNVIQSGESEANGDKNAKFVNSLDSFPTTNIDEVLQTATVLSSVAYPLPAESQDRAINSLKLLAGKTSEQASSPKLQTEFASTSLGTVVSLLKGVNVNEGNQTVEQEEEVDKSDDADKNKKVGDMLGVVEGSQQDILKLSVAGEEPTFIRSTGTVTTAVGFFDATELEGKQIYVDGALYVFPHYCDLIREEESCLTNKSISVGVKMANWVNQVYGFGGGRDLLSEESSTVQLSLVDRSLNVFKIEDSLSDIVIYIPRQQSDMPNTSLITPDMETGQIFMVHSIEVSDPRVGVSVFMRPEDPFVPEEWILTWSSVPPFNTNNFTVYNLVDLPYYEDLGLYGFFLNSEEVGKTLGNRYLGIAKKNTTNYENDLLEEDLVVQWGNDSSPLNISGLQATFEANYSLLTFVSACLFFDSNRLTWTSEGCKVIGANTTMTVCACNHLTSFGSGFIVAPNPIDFSYVFANAGFAQNLTIYLTLIIILVLYIIGLIYARIMDIRDKKKIGASPLPDNHPDDKYLYNIFVHTGLFPNSGTTSNVFFFITGDEDNTGVRELKDAERKVLQRGSHDHFVMATSGPLGNLEYLRIWHDNSGKGSGASWFFSYMVIMDIQTGKEFQFISNQWLAVEEGDGMIDRVIPAATKEDLKRFSHVFTQTVDRNLNDDHLWLSIFRRPPRSRFTRVQRLSSVMALLFLSLLVNAMFYERVPDSPQDGSLTVGPFSLSPQAMGVGLMSNLIVFPPSFLIVLFFRKARLRKTKPSRIKEALHSQHSKDASKDSKTNDDDPQQSDNKSLISSSRNITSATSKTEKQKEKKRKKRFRLHWSFRIIAWLLVVASIGSSLFFLWAYGITFGDAKVQKWLTSIVVSIATSILLTQPLKIYLMALILSMILKKPLNETEDYDDDEELMELDYDEDYVHSSAASSRRRKNMNLGSPYNQIQLEEARKKRQREVAINSLIVEIFGYLVFLTVILSISYGSRDPSIIYMKFHHKDLFGYSSTDNCVPFLEMKRTEDIWCWSREIFLPALLDDKLYNGLSINDPEITDKMDNTLTDRVSFKLGKAVFRQIRVTPNNCKLHPSMKGFIDECNGFSGFYDEWERDFGEGWNVTGVEEDTGGTGPFDYRSPLQVQGIPFEATLDTYGGGGYIVEIPNRMDRAQSQIDYLEANNWLDKYTRALFVELSIYNAQVNLFGVIICVAEVFPGGGLYTSFKYYGLNIYRYHDGAGFFMLVSELTFVIFTFFFIRREYKLWKKEGKEYFKSVWNWMEIVVIFLAITTIVFYTLKSIYSLYIIDKLLNSSGKKFIRMESLAVLDETLSYIIGFLLFFATIKLIKLLRFNRRIGFLSATLRNISTDIFGFFLIFIVVMISFVSVFYLVAVTASVEFSTFIRSAESSFFEITKKFKEVTTVSPVMGPIFYFIFAFIMYWIVLQVLIAIICHGFTRVKNDLSAQPNDFEVVDHLIEKFLMFLSTFNIIKGRVHDEDADKTQLEKDLKHIDKGLDRIIVLMQSEDLG